MREQWRRLLFRLLPRLLAPVDTVKRSAYRLLAAGRGRGEGGGERGCVGASKPVCVRACVRACVSVCLAMRLVASSFVRGVRGREALAALPSS